MKSHIHTWLMTWTNYSPTQRNSAMRVDTHLRERHLGYLTRSGGDIKWMLEFTPIYIIPLMWVQIYHARTTTSDSTINIRHWACYRTLTKRVTTSTCTLQNGSYTISKATQKIEGTIASWPHSTFTCTIWRTNNILVKEKWVTLFLCGL